MVSLRLAEGLSPPPHPPPRLSTCRQVLTGVVQGQLGATQQAPPVAPAGGAFCLTEGVRVGCPSLSTRLFEPAVDSISFNANHIISQGWRLVVVHRHSGEDWDLCPGDTYQWLTDEELLEVVDSTLISALKVEPPFLAM